MHQKKAESRALRFSLLLCKTTASTVRYCCFVVAGAGACWGFCSVIGEFALAADEPPAAADSELTPSAVIVSWSSWPEAFRPLEVWNSFTAFCVSGPILPSAVTFSLVWACFTSSGSWLCAAWLDFASLVAEAPFDCSLEDEDAPAPADMPLSALLSVLGWALVSAFCSWLI